MSRRVTAAVGAAVAVLGAVGAMALSDSDLFVVRQDPSAVAPGGLTKAYGTVVNGGPERTASPFTVLLDLPPGFTAEQPLFPADCRVSAAGHAVSCTFPPGLGVLRSATAGVPVRADANVPPGTKAEGHVAVVSADDRDPANDWTPFTLTVTG